MRTVFSDELSSYFWWCLYVFGEGLGFWKVLRWVGMFWYALVCSFILLFIEPCLAAVTAAPWIWHVLRWRVFLCGVLYARMLFLIVSSRSWQIFGRFGQTFCIYFIGGWGPRFAKFGSKVGIENMKNIDSYTKVKQKEPIGTKTVPKINASTNQDRDNLRAESWEINVFGTTWPILVSIFRPLDFEGVPKSTVFI